MPRKSIYQERYEKRRGYNNRFNKEHYKQVAIRFRTDDEGSKDKEAFEWLKEHENIAGYIKELILADKRRFEEEAKTKKEEK